MEPFNYTFGCIGDSANSAYVECVVDASDLSFNETESTRTFKHTEESKLAAALEVALKVPNKRKIPPLSCP